MPNSVTIRTTAPGAKQAAADLDRVGKSAQGIGAKAKTGLGGLGASLGGLVNPAFLAVGAVVGVTGALINGAKSATEEKRQLERLDTALQNNVTNWDGNRDAIDRAIESGMDLAFTDDTIRESLIKLVPATKDATQAIKLQKLAMNIARGRNIDLAAATDIVVKANMGNVGALRRMGIELDKDATRTEILTELQKTYAGQADAYAASTEGRIDRAKIKTDEFLEDLGRGTSEAFGEMLIGAEQFFDFLDTKLHPEDMARKLKGSFDSISDIPPPSMEDWGEAGRLSGQELADAAAEAFSHEWATKFELDDGVATGEWAAFTHRIREAAAQTGRQLTDDLAGALRSNKDVISDAMDKVQWAIEHPMALTRQKANLEGAMTTLEYKRGLHSNNEGITWVIDQQMQEIRDQWFALTGESWEAGHAVATAYERGLATMRPPSWMGRNPFRDPGREPGHRGPGGRARGGPVNPGQTYLVGEEGPELLQMGAQGGNVIPNNKIGGGGGEVHVHVHLEGDAAQMFRVIDREQGRSLALAQSSSYARG